ncbi:MAG: uroporphyrinogen decarboxylase family protein [Candidatus Freyrarchaeum guaymaensis]
MSGKVLEDVKKATHYGDYKSIADIVSNALKQGADPMDVMQALSEGIISVSGEYKTKGMYLDNIVLAAAAFEVGMAQITPIFEKEREKKEPLGKIVLGVVEGPWTIGKSIVAANLRAHGFEVIDAGSDVPPEKIAETTVESGANLVALGIYLTHAAPELAKLDEELWKLGVRHKVRTILSGPASSPQLAKKLGMDAYARDVKDLVAKAKEFAAELREELTPLERMMVSLRHKEPDRVPVVPFAQTFSAKFAGIPFSVYVSKGYAMAEGQIKAYEAFGWDAVCMSSDVAIYAEACGAKAEYPHDDVPRIVKPALNVWSMYDDFKKLDMPDPWKSGRLTESLKAIEIAKKELGPDVPVIGWIEGPFQGVALLAGGDPMTLFYVKDHPDEFREILDWYADWNVEVARAMYEAGADLIGAGEAAAYWMSPQFFEEFALQAEKKSCQGINKVGLPVLIHCCGYVPQCIHFIKETNPGGAIQFDYQVDLAWAKKLIGDTVTIMGNLNYNKLVNATPDEMYAACADAIRTAGSGGGYWLAFGCEIPREMPYKNIQAMVRAAKSVGKYPIQSTS